MDEGVLLEVNVEWNFSSPPVTSVGNFPASHGTDPLVDFAKGRRHCLFPHESNKHGERIGSIGNALFFLVAQMRKSRSKREHTSPKKIEGCDYNSQDWDLQPRKGGNMIRYGQD